MIENKKYLIFHNGDERFCIVTNIEDLKKYSTDLIEWISNRDYSPNRISIYELEESEFNWYNIHKDNFLFVKESAEPNEWQERTIGFVDDYGKEEIFDDKYEFECEFESYLGKELFCAYYNESELRNSGVFDAKRTYGKDFLDDHFKKWLISVKKALNEAIKLLETGGIIESTIMRTIPFNVSEDVSSDWYGKEKVVGITITEEDEVKFTSMDKSDNKDECLNFIRENYPNRRKRYHKDKWNSAFSIIDEKGNPIKVIE